MAALTAVFRRTSSRNNPNKLLMTATGIELPKASRPAPPCTQWPASQPAPEKAVRRDYAGEAGRGSPASAPASSPVPLRSQRCVMIRAALERKVLSRPRITDDCGEERRADRERQSTQSTQKRCEIAAVRKGQSPAMPGRQSSISPFCPQSRP
jgi:hypothetical protein